MPTVADLLWSNTPGSQPAGGGTVADLLWSAPAGGGPEADAGLQLADPGLTVSQVIDGDTVDFGDQRIRLEGVDTPEMNYGKGEPQPYAEQARDYMQQLLAAGDVSVEQGEDRQTHQRDLGFIRQGGVLADEELLRQGLGRAMINYPYEDEYKQRFLAAQQEAKDAGRGIWSEGEEQPVEYQPPPQPLTLEQQQALVDQRLDRMMKKRHFNQQVLEEQIKQGGDDPAARSQIDELNQQIGFLRQQKQQLAEGKPLTELSERGLQGLGERKVYSRFEDGERQLDGPLFVEDFDPEDVQLYERNLRDEIQEYAAQERIEEGKDGTTRHYGTAFSRIADEAMDSGWESLVQLRHRWGWGGDEKYADQRAIAARGRAEARRYFRESDVEGWIAQAIDSTAKSGPAVLASLLFKPMVGFITGAATFYMDTWNSDYNAAKADGLGEHAARQLARETATAEVGIMTAMQVGGLGGLEQVLYGGKAGRLGTGVLLGESLQGRARAAARGLGGALGSKIKESTRRNLVSIAKQAGEAIGPLATMFASELFEENVTSLVQANANARERGRQLSWKDVAAIMRETTGTTMIATAMGQGIGRVRNPEWRGQVADFVKSPSRANLKRLGWTTLATEESREVRERYAQRIAAGTAAKFREQLNNTVGVLFPSAAEAQAAFSRLEQLAADQGVTVGEFIINDFDQAVSATYGQAYQEVQASAAGMLDEGQGAETVRLYRAEPLESQHRPVSDWVKETPEYQRTMESAGRWFTDSMEEAQWYIDNEYPGGRIVYVDVPASEVEQYRVSNMENRGGKGVAENPRAFSRSPETEFFLPKDIAQQRRQAGEPDQGSPAGEAPQAAQPIMEPQAAPPGSKPVHWKRHMGRKGQWLGAQIAWDTMRTQAQDANPEDTKRPTSFDDMEASLKAILESVDANVPIRSGLHPDAVPKPKPKEGDPNAVPDSVTAGYYWGKTGVIRLRERRDIRTAAHEVGHVTAIAQGYGPRQMFQWVGGDYAIMDELRDAGMNMYPEEEPPNGWVDEGFAEYMAYLVTAGTDTARTKFPKFHGFYMGRLAETPKLQKAVHSAVQTVMRWETQGAIKRGFAELAFGKTRTERIKAMLTKKNFLRIRDKLMRHIEEFHPLGRYDDATTKAVAAAYKVDPEVAQSMLKKATKDKFIPDLGSYGLARGLRMRGNSLMNLMVLHQVMDGQFRPKHGIPTLQQAMTPLHDVTLADLNLENVRYKGMRDIHDLFQLYLLASAVAAEGKAKPNQQEIDRHKRQTSGPIPRWVNDRRGASIAFSDAEQIVADLGIPAFEQARSNLYNWWYNGILAYVGEVSPEHKRQITRIKKYNKQRYGEEHGFYIPMLREIDRDEDSGYALEGTPLNQGSEDRAQLTKARKGSSLPTKPGLDQLVRLGAGLIDAANHRMIADLVFDMHKFREGLGSFDLDKGAWIEELPMAPVRTDLPLRDVLSQVGKLLRQIGVEKKDIKGVLRSVDDDLSNLGVVMDRAFLAFYSDSDKARGQWRENPVYSRMEKGVMRFYRVNPRLHEVLVQNTNGSFVGLLRTHRLFRAIERLVFRATRMARVGYIQLNPTFIFATSPFREFTSYMQHATGSPVQNIADYLTSMGEVLRNHITRVLHAGATGANDILQRAVNKRFFPEVPVWEGPWLKLMRDVGVEMSTIFATDAADARALARRATGSKGWKDQGRAVLQELSEALSAFDMAPRMAAVKQAFRENNWDINKTLDLEAAITAKVVGSEITADYTAGSPFSRYLNGWLLFYNIQLQGFRFAGKHMKDHPFEFAMRLGANVGLELALWALHKDEEWWKERNRSEDLREFRMRIGDQVNRFPRNQEMGIVAPVVVGIVDAIYQRDPQTATEIADGLIWHFMPSQTLAKLVVEQLRNNQSYNDSPIVPPYLEASGVEERHKYTAYTSETAKAIGDVFNVSPARIEHATKMMLGAFGSWTMRLPDYAIGRSDIRKQREWEPSDIWVLGRFTQRGGLLGPRQESVDRLFELANRLNGMASYVDKEETPEERRLRLQVSGAMAQVGAVLSMRAYATKQVQRKQLTQLATDAAQAALADFEAQRLHAGPYIGAHAPGTLKRLQKGGETDPQLELDWFLERTPAAAR